MTDTHTLQAALVTTDLQEGVWRVTLNAPEARNAMGPSMCAALLAALQAMPSEARALYLTGAADSFCAGANLAESADRFADPNRDLGRTLDENYHPIFAILKAAKLPVIMGVNGPAVGIGLSLAQMGDLIIASESSYFALGFGKIALIPDGGATWLLPRLIGRARAMRMYMENAKISASEAYDWGLANHVLPDAGFQDAAFAIAAQAAQGPTHAIALTRGAFWAGLENPYPVQLEHEMRGQTEAGRGADFLEGVTAFLEKRPARFTGK